MKNKIDVNYYDLLNIYENNLCKTIKNKKKLYNFEKYKSMNINSAYNIINSENYKDIKYNIFIIRDPKYRIVMSLNILDKLINHYVCMKILIPKLTKRLDDRNVATRKGYGTKKGIELVKKYIEQMKKYENFYVLKMDVKKYFYSIDHFVLKNMVKPYINEAEYKIFNSIIDSTDNNYINDTINKLKKKESCYNPKRRKEIESIPLYKKGKGLPIGNLTSQFLAIYYLNELDHYIIHDLKLPKYVRYMDDFVIFCEDKEKLKKSYLLIEKYLNERLLLELNDKKSRINNIKDGFTFLGYRYRVKDKKTIITLCSSTKKRIKKRVKEVKYLYENKLTTFENVFCSINTYLYGFKYGSKLWVKRIIDNYFFN